MCSDPQLAPGSQGSGENLVESHPPAPATACLVSKYQCSATYMQTFPPRKDTPAPSAAMELIFLSHVLKGMKTTELTLNHLSVYTLKTRDLEGSIAERNFISQYLLIFHFPEEHIREGEIVNLCVFNHST